MIFDKLKQALGFEWDQGNLEKNWLKHNVSPLECEQVFFNKPLIVAPDEKHSVLEQRYYLLGQTDSGRRLFLVFTMRARKIRIISARNMSKKECVIYESQNNT